MFHRFLYNIPVSYIYIDLCGTPGYLAPEALQASMDERVPGYGKEVDMFVCLFVWKKMYRSVDRGCAVFYSQVGLRCYHVYNGCR